jgi:hypothetical protein
MRCRYSRNAEVAYQCQDENCENEFIPEGIEFIIKLHRVSRPKCLLVLISCFTLFFKEVLDLLFPQRIMAPAVSGRRHGGHG